MSELERQQQEILQSIEQKIKELKQIKLMLEKCRNDFMCATAELEAVRKQNDRLLNILHDCVTELCEYCQKANDECHSECSRCRWKVLKEMSMFDGK
jgi:flagellar biosynthesis chaperone FliJ